MAVTVPPCGPSKNPILAIVGEAPGKDEELKGQPFVGASGFLLNQMLAAAGISRHDCYITNVAKERPPNNKFNERYYENGNYKYPTSELLELRSSMWRELREVNPKVVIPMGNEALKAIGGNATSISNYRGTMIEHHGLRILPTYHPAYILRSYTERPIVEADLKKAFRQALNPSKPKTFFNYDPNFSEVMDFLKTRPPLMSMDIETLGKHTRCFGFAWSRHDAISIPLISRGNHHWPLDQEMEILMAMNTMLLSPDIGFILQNSSYDFQRIAKEFGFQVRNFYLDTMFAHHLLYPELPKGLDFLSSLYTDHPMYWGYDSSNDISTREYNCMDCVVTFEAAEEIVQELKERNLLDYYHRLIHRAVPALNRVESRGVLIDTVLRAGFGVRTRTEMDEIKVKLQALLGFELNPSSPKQVQALVYDTWKLPKQIKPGTKAVTTDEDALKALIRKSKDSLHIEVMKLINLFRQKRTFLSTFVEMNLDGERIRTSYSLARTVTGRLASSATIDDIGGNLQNIPRGEFRKVFIADSGKLLIKADLSQAEYRVLIWKARIHRVIERLLDPKFSIHMWNAAENIYRVPYADVTKKMYDEAKNGTYAANYGVGALKVSRMYDMEISKAKFIIERYHEAVPEIQQTYQKEIRDQIQTTRELVNPFGRQRLFFGRMDDELYRAAYSHYCQSTVGDLVDLALIDLDENAPDWLDVDPLNGVLLQVHDELVVQVPEDKISEGCALVKKAMEIPMNFPGVDIPLTIPVEIKVGRNWGETKSLPDFLKDKENA